MRPQLSLSSSHLVYGLSQIGRKEDIKKGTMLRLKIREVLRFLELLSLTASGICLGLVPACRLYRCNAGEPRSSNHGPIRPSPNTEFLACASITMCAIAVIEDLLLLVLPVRNNTQPNDGVVVFHMTTSAVNRPAQNLRAAGAFEQSLRRSLFVSP